jgi:hypothetical protein
MLQSLTDADFEENTMGWEVDEFGVKRRSIVTHFALPTPFLHSISNIKAKFVDVLLADESMKHAVIETKILFEGIPGGSCSAVMRQCLSSTTNGMAEYIVTADIKAPEKSWFKGTQGMVGLGY